MFKQARLKLTALYLLIIMAISLSFSCFIYQSVNSEFGKRFDVIEGRLGLGRNGTRLPKGSHSFFVEDANIARANILYFLVYANGAILIFSGIAGYFLAGRTLSPIEKAMEEQKRFVADASHELKTPLTALQTSIEVSLRDKKLKLKDAKKILEQNLDDVKSLTSLSNNLLAMSRFQQNGSSLDFGKVDLKKTINTALEKITSLAKKRRVDIKILGKNAKVKANEESLEKLITILLDNAIKFTPKKGKVIISLSRGKKCAVVRVKDTGVGISKKDLPHIFDRFYRADTSRSKIKTDGFGLGLSMAKKIVELHKGSIKVKSEVGKGSIFTVKLPLTQKSL